jgi:hypothetical protein
MCHQMVKKFRSRARMMTPFGSKCQHWESLLGRKQSAPLPQTCSWVGAVAVGNLAESCLGWSIPRKGYLLHLLNMMPQAQGWDRMGQNCWTPESGSFFTHGFKQKMTESGTWISDVAYHEILRPTRPIRWFRHSAGLWVPDMQGRECCDTVSVFTYELVCLL